MLVLERGPNDDEVYVKSDGGELVATFRRPKKAGGGEWWHRVLGGSTFEFEGIRYRWNGEDAFEVVPEEP